MISSQQVWSQIEESKTISVPRLAAKTYLSIEELEGILEALVDDELITLKDNKAVKAKIIKRLKRR